MKKYMLYAAVAAVVSSSNMAMATEHVIKMLNKGTDGTAMVFEPLFLRAEIGDTIKFVPIDKGHQVQTIAKFWPSDVPEAKSNVNEEYVMTLTKEGAYGFKCAPHYSMGMIAVVVVGAGPVPDEMKADSLPNLAKKRAEAAFALAATP